MDGNHIFRAYRSRLAFLLIAIFVLSVVTNVALIYNDAKREIENNLMDAMTHEQIELHEMFKDYNLTEMYKLGPEKYDYYTKDQFDRYNQNVDVVKIMALYKDEVIYQIYSNDIYFSENQDVLHDILKHERFLNIDWISKEGVSKTSGAFWQDNRRLTFRLSKIDLEDYSIIIAVGLEQEKILLDSTIQRIWVNLLIVLIVVLLYYMAFNHVLKITNRNAQDNEYQMHLIVDNIHSAVLVYDTEQDSIVYYNQCLREMLGDVNRSEFNKVLGRDSKVFLRDLNQKSNERPGVGYETEFYSMHLKKWLCIRSSEIKWTNNKILSLLVVRDTTISKQVEAENISLNEMISNFFTITSEPIFEVSLKGEILHYYGNSLNLAERSSKELLGQNFFNMVLYEDRALLNTQLSQASENHQHIQDLELRLEGESGFIYNYSIDILPIYNKSNEAYKFQIVHRDITSKKAFEQQLAIMSSIFSSSSSFICIINLEGKIIMSNNAVLEVTGYTSSHLLKYGYEILFDEQTNTFISKNVMPAVFAKKSYNCELTLLRQGGEKSLIEVNFLKLSQGNSENCIGIAFIANVITETRRLERVEAISGSILDSISDYVTVRNLNHEYIYMNEMAATITGYEQGKKSDFNEYDLYPPGYEQKLYNEIFPYVMENGIWTNETWMKTAFGDIIEVQHTFFVVRDKHCGVIGYGTILRDISDAKAAERKIKENEALLQGILDSIPGYVWSVDSQQRILFFNGEGLNLLGLSQHDVLHKKIDTVFTDSTNLSNILTHMIESKNTYVWTDKRDNLYYDNYNALLFNEDHSVKQLICVSLDVSSRIHVQQQLLIAKEQAETASKSKSEFLSRMSHEIRTPMNAIIGMSRIAINHTDIEKMRGSVKKIDVASKHLLRIINDILDISKIEAGKLKLENAPFNLENVINTVLALSIQELEGKNVVFVSKIAEELPIAYIGDATRLTQLIMNLVSNAIKFTSDKGKIRLFIDQGGLKGTKRELLITIWDAGIGIAPQDLGRIFNSFEQGEGSLARRYEGTGLGLPIVKNIVQMMGGDIHVISLEGKGSCFYFNLWIERDLANEQGSEKTEKNQPEFNFSGKRVLVFEDLEINREILAFVLQDTHVAIDFAYDGNMGIEMLKNSEGKYDLILMDIQMPHMDGYEATRIIRKKLSESLANIPIIAMTANVFREDVEKALAIGMNSHVGKPIDEWLLKTQLSKFLYIKEELDKGQVKTATETPFVFELIDPDEGLKKVKGNKNLYIRLCKRFVSDANIGKLREAMESGNDTEARQLVSAIKGSVQNLEIVGMKKYILDIEQTFRSGRATRETQLRLLTQLENVHRRVLVEIERIE